MFSLSAVQKQINAQCFIVLIKSRYLCFGGALTFLTLVPLFLRLAMDLTGSSKLRLKAVVKQCLCLSNECVGSNVFWANDMYIPESYSEMHAPVGKKKRISNV